MPSVTNKFLLCDYTGLKTGQVNYNNSGLSGPIVQKLITFSKCQNKINNEFLLVEILYISHTSYIAFFGGW